MHERLGWPGPVTWRQHLAWARWLDDDLNRPSRSDYYAMAVRSQLLDKPTGNLEELRVTFRTQAEMTAMDDLSNPLSVRSQAVAISRARIKAIKQQLQETVQEVEQEGEDIEP